MIVGLKSFMSRSAQTLNEEDILTEEVSIEKITLFCAVQRCTLLYAVKAEVKSQPI